MAQMQKILHLAGRCAGIGMLQVVGKKKVCDFIFTDIIDDVTCEITEVNHIDIFERMKKKANKGIAETVFDDQQPSSVSHTCADMRSP